MSLSPLSSSPGAAALVAITAEETPLFRGAPARSVGVSAPRVRIPLTPRRDRARDARPRRGSAHHSQAGDTTQNSCRSFALLGLRPPTVERCLPLLQPPESRRPCNVNWHLPLRVWTLRYQLLVSGPQPMGCSTENGPELSHHLGLDALERHLFDGSDDLGTLSYPLAPERGDR